MTDREVEKSGENATGENNDQKDSSDNASNNESLSLHSLLSTEHQEDDGERSEDSGLLKLQELAKEIEDKKSEDGESSVSPAGTTTLRPSVPPPSSESSPDKDQEDQPQTAAATSPAPVTQAAVPAKAAPEKSGMNPMIIGVIVVLAVAVIYLLVRQPSATPQEQAAQTQQQQTAMVQNSAAEAENRAPVQTPGKKDETEPDKKETGSTEDNATASENAKTSSDAPGKDSKASVAGSAKAKTPAAKNTGDQQDSDEGTGKDNKAKKELYAFLDKSKKEDKSPTEKSPQLSGQAVDSETVPIADKNDTKAKEEASEKESEEDQLDDLLSSAVNRKTDSKKESESTGGQDDGLPEKLSREQINSGMRSIVPRVKTCARYGKGTVNVEVSITNNGRVSRANPLGAFSNTPAGKCVAMMVRMAKFPKFKRKVITLTYPFVL